jgi:alginate O-acetyltransferase complex protein AlgI
MIVANTVGVFADATFNNSYGHYNSLYAWLGILCYTLQIYFDFSGYSDMAIGIGRMFGFEFKQNFNLPYAAKSIKTFWQKWHISLSSWFKDYLYIPLGGNKRGNLRTALNLFIVFILCGLWHGANYTFLVWGLFHGLFLVLERVFGNSIKFKIPAIVSHGYVWLVVMMSWVFFRAETITEALAYFKTMFSFNLNIETAPDLKSFINPYFIFILFIGILSSIGLFKTLSNSILKKKIVNVSTYRLFEFGTLIILFYWCVLEIINSNFNPFIYYRF